MSLLSVVVPCFNEEETVQLFYDAVTPVLEKLPQEYELIFVNDGSRDHTLALLQELYQSHQDTIRVIDFSRNFGKESALLAGLRAAQGDYVIVMDADLQDPPQLIPKMFETMEAHDDDVVGTRRVTREGEPKIRSFFARQFYRLINRWTEVEIVDGARDFRLMKRPVVDAILSLQEYGRFSKGLFAWVGFRCEYLEYENVKRAAGETKWSFWKLFRYAIDGIVEFTSAPAVLAARAGIPLTAVMLVVLIVELILALCGRAVTFEALLLSVILFLAGLILSAIGILGEYLSKTYNETKKRPSYIIRKFYH